MKHAYILGPMTGIPQENRPAFRRAASALRKLGYQVTSADELDTHDPAGGKAWADYLRRDIPHVVKAEVGFALPGWRESRGATLEATILTQLSVPIYELIDGTRPSPERVPTSNLPTPMYPPSSGGN